MQALLAWLVKDSVGRIINAFIMFAVYTVVIGFTISVLGGLAYYYGTPTGAALVVWGWMCYFKVHISLIMILGACLARLQIRIMLSVLKSAK